MSRKVAVPRPLTPALAKQPSTRPSLAIVSAKAASTACSFETSHSSASTLRPVASSSTLAAAFFFAFVPQIATSAPAWASARAMPRPMPLLPPVTRATVPVRSKGLYTGVPRLSWLIAARQGSPFSRGRAIAAYQSRPEQGSGRPEQARGRPEQARAGQRQAEQSERSEQEIALRQRQGLGRLATQEFAVGTHFVGLGIDLDVGRRVVENHRCLRNAAARILDCQHPLLHAKSLRQEAIQGCLADEGDRRGGKRAPKG